ncbi:hypothetical protein BDR05DRAFT_947865 [Suillus weaverae]|nr:hypothetical protein BDR05DRAFT_947865 [Suillus weaverae]
MHRCLSIPDIIYMIFYLIFNSTCVDPDYPIVHVDIDFHKLPRLIPRANRIDRPSILNLALTCRAFREPAQHVLHSHLRDIRPVIKPQALILLPWVRRTSDRCELVRYPTWVKILDSFLELDHAAYPFLLANAPKDAPLFPNLRSLTWRDCHLASIPALSLLLPTVENLSLTLSTPFCDAVIPGLRDAAPRLKALEIKGELFTLDDPTTIDSLLRSYDPEGLTHLSLKSCNIPSSLLRVIAPWRRLRRLTLRLGHESIPNTPFHRVLQPFEALVDLLISCKDLGYVISFLRAFQMLRAHSDDEIYSIACSSLRRIHVTADHCSPISIWSELLSIVIHTKLEQIILVEKCDLICLAHSSIDFHLLLRHPTTLAGLKTLVLSPGPTSSIALTNTDLLTLARTCPHLSFLDLGARNTPVSIYALDALVRRCRELLQVSLCVDARLETLGTQFLSDDDKVDLQPNTRLVKLDVGESLITSIGPSDTPMAPDLWMDIPMFLHKMAPFLTNLTERPPGAWYREEECRMIVAERNSREGNFLTLEPLYLPSEVAHGPCMILHPSDIRVGNIERNPDDVQSKDDGTSHFPLSGSVVTRPQLRAESLPDMTERSDSDTNVGNGWPPIAASNFACSLH